MELARPDGDGRLERVFDGGGRIQESEAAALKAKARERKTTDVYMMEGFLLLE